MTELDLVKADMKKCGILEKYVYLRKDEKGFYIEYAFREGAPHDNRCLDWYHSYQEEAYIENKWFERNTPEEQKQRLADIKADRDSKVGKLYYLSSMTCGGEENPKEQIERHKKNWSTWHPDEPFIPSNVVCKVGKPSHQCLDGCASHWTYECPVKCACWYLSEEISLDEFINNYTISIKPSKLLEIINKANNEEVLQS